MAPIWKGSSSGDVIVNLEFPVRVFSVFCFVFYQKFRGFFRDYWTFLEGGLFINCLAGFAGFSADFPWDT
jgi:hypothetical protein